MDSLTRQFQLLCSSLEAIRPQAVGRAAWQPAADLYRCAHGWLVKFDLAGVRPEEIRLEITERGLRVSGSRRDWTVTETREAHQLEIAYSHFERTIDLPVTIANAEVRTDYRDGMFLVQIITEPCHE